MGLRTELACLDDVQRAERFNAETFEAFALTDSGRAYRAKAHDTETLGKTLANLAIVYGRGEKVMVRQTNTLTGEALLRFYAIREGKPTWMHIGHEVKRVGKRYADHLFDLKPEGLL